MTTRKYVSKKQLFAATERGDERALKHYIEKVKLSLTSTNTAGQTAAHIATTKDNLKIVKYLLSKDMSVLEVADISGKTLLHVAVENGSLDTVKYLVDEAGADTIATNRVLSNNTPIHVAAEHGHLSILRFLVDEKKVDVDTRNEAGETAIFLAAEKPHTEVIKYLAEVAKANLTVTDEKNEHVLFVSARVGDLQVPKYLLETLKVGIDVNWKDAQGYTLAHTAARYNHLESLKYFVEGRGADVEVFNNEGWTPLHEAASGGFLEVVQYLLKNGARVDSRNKAGRTAFHVAGDKSVKRYLETALAQRHRRSVVFRESLPAVPAVGLRNEPLCDRITDRLKGGKGRFPGSVERNSYNELLLGLLVFTNMITKSRRSKTAFPECSQTDLNTIDAVDGTFSFGELSDG